MDNSFSSNMDELMKAAQNGDANAQYRLGKCYHEGKGVEVDYRKAYDWYVEAALQDHEMAKNDLGILFYIEKHPELQDCDPTEDADVTYGDIRYGLGQALIKARDKRADEGNVDSQYSRGADYFLGKYSEQDYVKAREWLSKAAEKGHDRAQYFMGEIYLNGLGAEVDYAKAREWYAKSAEQGLAESQFKLAVIYYLGHGVKVDVQVALDWCLKAAEQGVGEAQYMAAGLYSGNGLEVDNEKAAYWYEKAAWKCVNGAAYKYGVCCEKGLGIEKNPEKAVEWYKSAAEAGDKDAQHRLGYCYCEGVGVKMNFDEARKWYTKAAEQGNEQSVKGLLFLDWKLNRDKESENNLNKNMTYEEYVKLGNGKKTINYKYMCVKAYILIFVTIIVSRIFGFVSIAYLTKMENAYLSGNIEMTKRYYRKIVVMFLIVIGIVLILGGIFVYLSMI